MTFLVLEYKINLANSLKILKWRGLLEKLEKILGTSFLATTVTLSGVGPVLMNGSTASAKTAQSEELPSSPIDMNTVPEERLANALKNQGVISQSATPQEVKKAVTSYINKKMHIKRA